MSSNLENETLGKFDIIREIGRGNMATVYLGHDSFSARDVAIKVAHPEILRDEASGGQYRKLFFNEAKVAGMLKHPNVVSIYDAGVEGDICYITMEYIPGGQTLKSHTQPDTLLPVEDVAQIVFKCAKALDHAHKKGVIHRDVKPANLMLTEDGDVKVVDFGVAMMTQSDVAGTQVQGYVGSPLYMSPEQVQQDEITTRTDLFSIGVVMYEMPTGQHPFIADSLPAIIHRIANEPHQPMGNHRQSVPEILERIVGRTLRKDPQRRYKTGLDLAGDLSLVFEELQLSEEDISDQEKFNLIRDLEFFKEFEEPEAWEVIHASKWEEFRPGESIVSEGELDSSFYVVVSGECSVLKNAESIHTIRQGECFGEMGFISRETRSATVAAGSDTLVMKVSAPMIERSSANCQLRFHKVFLNTLVRRLRTMTERA